VFVLEVNGIPGWQGLQRATGIDVAGTVVDHLLDRVRRSRPAAAVPV
jgi:glutathione synthase/RimK-type ligase-like ATP-grasp enzyme